MDETRDFHAAAGLDPASTDGPAPLRLIQHPDGQVHEVQQPDTLVGRHSRADLRLPQPDVSRHHCRLLWTGDGWRVLDLRSLNGVHVNDQPVQEAVLHQGDRLRIGSYLFEVDLSQVPAEEPAPGEAIIHSIFRALPPPSGQRRRAS